MGPPAHCIAELHLPKRSEDGGNSLRCWRIASWANNEAAMAASYLTLNAPDQRAAMERDLGVMRAAWERRRAELLRDGPAQAGWPEDEDAAQALLGTASATGNVLDMECAVAAGADVNARVYFWKD